MVTAQDLSRKSDAELLEIWKRQVDYHEKVVGWVAEEIERRGLRTDEIVLVTEGDQARREEEYYDSKFKMFRALKFWFFGGVSAFFGLGAFIEGIRNARDRTFLLILSAALLSLAALVIWVARRSWKNIKV